jgi:hypothetical protein
MKTLLIFLYSHEALSEEDLDLVYAGFLQTKCSPDSALSAFVCSEYIETAVLRNNEETSGKPHVECVPCGGIRPRASTRSS